MKERYRLYIIPLLLIVLAVPVALAHTAGGPRDACRSESAILNAEDETILLHTDRYRYIAGEAVWFSIYVTSSSAGMVSPLYSVAHVELFNPRNQPVARKRFLLAGGRGEGVFVIPDTASSGTYAIRICSGDPETSNEYNCIMEDISVVNALGSLKYIEKLRADESLKDNKPFSPSDPGRMIKVEYDTVAGRRSKVKITVTVNDPGSGICQMSMSVAPSAAVRDIEPVRSVYYPPGIKPGKSVSPFKAGNGNSFHMLRLALKRTGSNTVRLPEHVYMSVQGKVAEFGYGKVDSDGICLIPLPVDAKQRNLVLQPAKPVEGITLDLLPSFPVNGPGDKAVSTLLNDSLTALFSALSFNHQVSAIYRRGASQWKEEEESQPVKRRRFYGIPEMEIRLDDYIRLPSMQEVFFELLPGINFVNRRGEYKMLISNPLTGDFYNDSPLVMIDGVIINDLETLADLDPESVERIEVVKTPYIFGDLVIYGIVNIITYPGDFSLGSLPEYAIIVPYRVVESRKLFISPDYSDADKLESRIPDLRNTLYWNPSIRAGARETAAIEFYTSDLPGEYTIDIKGITGPGYAFSVQKKISVR